jgi:hypothetical protein
MRSFTSLENLIESYALNLMIDQLDLERDTALRLARSKIKYVPVVYKGGYVIPGFGFSTERIFEGYVHPLSAGDPESVEGFLKRFSQEN